ncbi:MAG: hypothetical protein OEY56_08935, partial [Cyclobacteriaceae bacterium]|nr:hypothetical protein [Cyclobacteriaceae bacterium]
MWRIFFVSLLVTACSSYHAQDDRIIIPAITPAFYQESVDVLEEKILESPGNQNYIRMQLGLYEQLGWPMSASLAIDRAEAFFGNEPWFIQQ